MNFGEAFEQVKQGKGMRLPQWNSGVVVQAFIPKNIEEVAEDVHNVWWSEKIEQGITNHPDMIPYSELAENIKEFDRVTARAILDDNMSAPYLYVSSRYGKVPWKETFIELFSEDWEVVDFSEDLEVIEWEEF